MAAVALDGTSHQLDPRVRTVWAVSAALLWVVLGLAISLAGVLGSEGPLVVAGVVGALAGVALGVGWASVKWEKWSWRAHDDALEVRHGVVLQHVSLVPFHRIQQIDLQRGPVERVLGLSTLVLRTAAATTDASLPGIAAGDAEALRLRLLTRAGVDDAV